MRLRLKLILIALVAAVFPLAGWRFVKQMEDTLRQGQEQALIAQGVALARAELALEAKLGDQLKAPQRLYTHAIDFELTADGYSEDWAKLILAPQNFRADNGELPVDFISASSASAYFLWFSIGDLSPVFADAFGQFPERSDHVLINLEGLQYRIACGGAGPASVVPVQANNPPLPPASCQLRDRGYNVEVRIPKSRLFHRIGFRVVDYPVAGADLPSARTGTFNADQSIALWPLTTASLDAASTRALAPPGVRLRILAPDGFVLRKSGSLTASSLQDSELGFRRWLRAWVYRALLAPPLVDDQPYRFDNMIVRSELTEAALRGQAGAVWRPAGSRATVVLTAVIPIDANNPERGVLLLEKGSDALLIWSNRALGALILGGLLTMLVAASILFGYAGWLSLRIRRLKLATENALTPEGKLRGNFPQSRTVDEIGDLSRSFGKLLDQVGETNEYLRTLSSKLSHELSTPLAVVRSSLENLEHEAISINARTYAQRAKTGADRLMQILRSMSEASRIERAITSAEGEQFDLRAVITGAAAAYRDLAGARELFCEVPSDQLPMFGAPELIHQALDKLVDNALSFTPDSGWIKIVLRANSDGSIVISVLNSGPTLPEKMRERLFDSLVSMRDGKPGSAHLGLGLYIVRLIAELHGGKATADNLADGSGVEVTMKLIGMRR